MGSIDALRLFQWGKETTRGTAVAATSKMAIPFLDLQEEDTMHRPFLAKGLGHRYPGSETPVQRYTSWSVPEFPVIYDQLQHWLSMSVMGGITAVGTAPEVWTFARSLTADPVPHTWTLERRVTDGSSPVDNEFAYAFAHNIGFSWAAGEPILMTADGCARRKQTSTLTAAQAMPTIEIPPVALSKMYIDSTWANLGTTQITGQILSASIGFATGLKPIWTLDARADMDYTAYVPDFSAVGLDVEITALLAGQYATEQTAAEAGTIRAVRLQVDGTSSRQIQFDMLLKHDKASLFKIGSQDGQDLVTMNLVDTDDGTNMFRVKLSNNIATYA